MENRVHGNIHISRRTLNEDRNKQEDKKMLSEDFKEICGYCAKNSRIFLEEFHIDHFAPKSKFPERKKDYSNYVLACPQCNRLKSDKWVTEDPYISHTEENGFIDPATEEYDEHLYRDENGNIKAKTKVGEYMCEVFKFDIRPISLIWKIEKLEQLQEILEKDSSNEGAQQYRKVAIALKEIIENIRFEKKE